MTSSPADDRPGTLRTPAEWYALGRELFQDVIGTLARYGVRPDPRLRFVPAASPTPYYAPATMTIGFGVPDPATVKGRLYWYFVQHLVGAADLAEVQAAMEVPLPWTVAHEVVHHLRHHYRAPVESDFVEEQVANCVAIALLGEHPRYQPGLPPLRQWADRVFAQVRALSPETVPYLAGFRLDIGEVLVASQILTSATVARAHRLAAVTDAAVEDVLLRTGWVSAAQLDRARTEQAAAEQYFNGRYMASLGEYWTFGTEWLARYLERDDMPSLGEALERHILTRDWEASRHEATRLFLEQQLRSDDAAVASAAADALAAHDGTAAIPALVAALDDPRPSVQATTLRTLGQLPGGPAAGSGRARVLLHGEGDVRGEAARLLRLAGMAFSIPEAATPAERTEWALARLADEPDATYGTIRAMLEEDEASVLAALGAWQEAGAEPPADRIAAFLVADSAALRAAATRALPPSAQTAMVLLPRLGDVAPSVRRAAEEAIHACGSAAWPALAAAARSADPALRVAAACLAARLGAPEASRLLDDALVSIQNRARRMARIEAADHPGLELLAQAAGEERHRLARLALRAVGQTVDATALELAERMFESADPVHHAGGRDVLRHTFGRKGRDLAHLLASGGPVRALATPRQVVAASAAAESIALRAIAAYTAPRVLARTTARAILRRFDAESERLVRSEAERAREYWPGRQEAAMLTTVEKLMYLRAVPTFAGCELDILLRVADTVIAQQFDAGEVILREGEPGRHMFVVTHGRVAITVHGRPVDELGPRQYFGEMALFDGAPRSATVTAIEATTLLRLDRDELYRLGRQTPELLVGVIRVLSGRLREALADASPTGVGPRSDTRSDRERGLPTP
jgi:hypothetical protein